VCVNADDLLFTLVVHPQVNMKLNQEEGGSVVKTLLHLQITDIMADVKDRSWDTSATVGIGDIAIFDHIKLGKIVGKKS